MGSDESRAFFLKPRQATQELPPLNKDELAQRLVDEIIRILEAKGSRAAAAPTS